MMRARLLSALTATLVACSASPASPPPVAGSCGYDALVAASDYASSGVGGFTVKGAGFASYGIASHDPALSVSNGRAFLVLRDLGQIIELDPGCGTATNARFLTNDPGESGTSNPQDVAAADDGSLWVPRYDVPSVVQIAKDGSLARTIALTSTAYDPDGNPNASAIAIVPVNGVAKAFVALEVLDDSALPRPAPYPDMPSLVLQIDLASGAIESATPLAGRNPFGLFFSYGGALWMAEPGSFGDTHEALAGIERFDPQTRTSKLVMTEAAFGGSVAEVAVTSECGVAIVADATSKNATSLVTFDPDAGTVLSKAPLLTTAGYDLQAMLWVGDVLLVGDRTQPAGGGRYAVHAFDRTGGCTLTKRADAIFLELPPVAFRPTR